MSRRVLLASGRPVSALLATLLLAGCSGALLESKKVDYKSIGKAPSLEIPPDLTAPTRDERYAVPDVGGKGAATYSAYSAERTPEAKAQEPAVLPQVSAKMRIERSGSQRWLVVPAAPDQVWEKIKDFWQDTGFIIKAETPDAGVMETDWAEDRAKIPQGFIRDALGKVIDSLYSTAERDKFRTRLEPGAEAGTTEIFISHRGMVEVYISEGKDQTRWQPRPADPELEAEMLRRLMVHLGSDEKRATAAVASATADKPQERATLLRAGDGAASLELQERFDRAWRRVGLALDRVGFTVEDRDRSNGVYFVRYVDPEADNKRKDEPGLLSKLAFWKDDKVAVTKPQTQFRVVVSDQGGQSRVRVLNKDGGGEVSESAQKILALLHDQLK